MGHLTSLWCFKKGNKGQIENAFTKLLHEHFYFNKGIHTYMRKYFNQVCHPFRVFVLYKNYNLLACDWFKKVLFSTNSLAKLLSDSLLLDSLLLDSLLSDSLISQSHSKM